MKATLRQYRDEGPEAPLGADYAAVRAFLLRLASPNYLFGRWDWMVTHPNLEGGSLGRIGLWERAGELVAIATFDCNLGDTWLLTLPGFDQLRAEMLTYASQQMTSATGGFGVIVPDGDLRLADLATGSGLRPTQHREFDSMLPIASTDLSCPLPAGFSVVSLADHCDLYQYERVLHHGFDHAGKPPFTWNEQLRSQAARQLLRPGVDLSTKIAVVAPSGEFVSYCGMWQDPASEMALVEPVATDTAYRRLGLGRAAVLAAVARCGQLGATQAVVGSNLQFYYRIGFRPFATATWWRRG